MEYQLNYRSNFVDESYTAWCKHVRKCHDGIAEEYIPWKEMITNYSLVEFVYIRWRLKMMYDINASSVRFNRLPSFGIYDPETLIINCCSNDDYIKLVMVVS